MLTAAASAMNFIQSRLAFAERESIEANKETAGPAPARFRGDGADHHAQC
jgi:hypothetical protein